MNAVKAHKSQTFCSLPSAFELYDAGQDFEN